MTAPNHDKVFLMRWSSFEQLADTIAEKLHEYRFDAIVGISRGGLVPAVYLANALRVDVLHPLQIKRNDSSSVGSSRGEPYIMNGFVTESEYSRILVVDDACSEGLTLKCAVNYLAGRQRGAAISTAALVVNTTCRLRPDFFGDFAHGWIVFPWEKPPSLDRKVVVEV